MSDVNQNDRMQQSLDAAKARTARTGISAPRPPKITNVASSLAPSAHKPADTKPRKVEDAIDHDVAMRMAFLGTGQGGGRIANAFWGLGYRRVAAFNTTDQDFNGLDEAIEKLSLHVGGAGKDMEIASGALRGREEDVRDLLVKAWGDGPVDCAMVCASLGGGTGSGTAPELVRIARKYMTDRGLEPRVGAIVSLPPVAEGYQICRNAVLGFQRLVEAKVSPLIIIDNARIHELYRPAMTKLHPTANDTVAQLFHLFNQLAAVRSELITFDRSEFAQILDSGLVVMGSADIQNINSPTDVSGAIRDQLSQSVLAQVDLKTGRKAACLFVGGADTLDKLDLDYYDAGFTQLNRILGSAYGEKTQTVVHRGLYPGQDPGLQAYIMVGELAIPRERLQLLAREGGLGDARSRVADFLGVQDGQPRGTEAAPG